MDNTTIKSIEFNNLQRYNSQHINSSNVVFDSGGNGQFNSTTSIIANNYNEISGLRLAIMVAPFTVIFVLAVTGKIDKLKMINKLNLKIEN